MIWRLRLLLEGKGRRLAGGYVIWSAHVASIGGGVPANNTTIQAAPAQTVDC